MTSLGQAASRVVSIVRAIEKSLLPRRARRSGNRPSWQSIAAATSLACAFLLPAFAAQAQVNTVTAVTSQTPNPSQVNQSVTFVITVTAASGTTAPTGQITLFNTSSGATQIGSASLSASGTPGVATTTIMTNTSFNQAGSFSILANYSGALNTFNSSSTTVTQTVGTPTTTGLTSLPNPSTPGQSVTLTATVTNTGGATTPSGTVQFTENTTTLGTINLSGSGTSATATLMTTALVTGTVQATYLPAAGSGFISSNGQVSQTVANGAITTTMLGSSPNPSQVNQSVTFTATVTNTSSAATPTGTVTFIENTTTLGTGTLSGSGNTATATFTTSFATASGSNPIFASYNGVPNTFLGSQSNTINQVVNNGANTTTTLNSSPNPSQTNQSVTLTATVTNTSGAATPGGNVTFTEGATTLASNVTVSGSGNTATATITTTSLVTGTVTATYNGVAGSFAPSTGTVNQTVSAGTIGTTTTLISSANPSSVGQLVTFTATVTKASGNVNPGGTITFKDNGTTIVTVGVSSGAVQTASFSTSILTAGSHPITAVYSGDPNFSPSTSAVLTQNVGSASSSDSTKLHQMQTSTTPVIGAAWGATTSSAMDDAVSAGFGGNPQSLSPAGTGFTYYFNDDAPAQHSTDTDQDSLRRYLASPTGSLTSPDGSAKSAAADASAKRVDDDCRALGYAGGMPTKAPPPAAAGAPHDWLAWVTVRGTDYWRNTFGNDLKGDQVDVIFGLTRRISANFVVGVLGGYEHFDYTSQAFTAHLKGDGWTVGAYLGWKLAPNLRFDAGGAWSDIMANDTAGTAAGNFTGTRWLINGGLTGTYPWQMLVLEPSARVFALWEHENAFTDSLGTVQPARNFETGRASAGVKAIYPFAWTSSTVALSPYAGLYADYYFSSDDAQTVGLTTVPLLQGFSARVTGGVAASFNGGATLGAGGEFGGIGNTTHIWTWTARGRIPF